MTKKWQLSAFFGFVQLINLPAVGEGWGGGLPFTCFAMCDRVNEGRQDLLEEVSEGSLEPLDKRSVILMLENNILCLGMCAICFAK